MKAIDWLGVIGIGLALAARGNQGAAAGTAAAAATVSTPGLKLSAWTDSIQALRTPHATEPLRHTAKGTEPGVAGALDAGQPARP